MIDWITLIFGLILGFIVGALCTKIAVLRETTKLWIEFVKRELKENGFLCFSVTVSNGKEDEDDDEGDMESPGPECDLCSKLPNGFDVRLN
jgi:hypothetical protein